MSSNDASPDTEMGKSVTGTARSLEGFPRALAFTCAISLTLVTFYAAFFGVFLPMIQRSLHICLLLAIIFLWFPASKRSPKNSPSIIDYILCFTTLAILAWTIYSNTRFIMRIPFYGAMESFDIFSGLAITLLILEAGRRTLGMTIVVIAGTFIGYAFAGPWMPEMLVHKGMSLMRFIDIIYMTDMGAWGSLVGTSATLLFIFISFGVFLQATKTDKHYMDISLGIAGGKPGGPAKVAVISSAAMGTISGSTIANVVTTGTLTIPLMKKSGYTAEEAGAIETVSSSGGQIMPPIMGTGAFIMADFIGVPYFDIVRVSVLPALLFYVVIYLFVDIKAKKKGLQGLPRHMLPSVKEVLKKNGYLFLPVFILLTLLCMGFTPFLSGASCCVLIVLFSLIKKETHIGWKNFFMALEECSISVAKIAGVIACAAIIVAMINYTGLMVKSTSVILYLSAGSLPLTILVVGLIAYLLGMGLPIVTAYVILATLAAPALAQLGVPPLAGHLMIFWFSQLSGISPPVCMAAFAAAGIAGGHPMKTGFAALGMGASFYFVPILFPFTHILDIDGHLFGAFLDTFVGGLAALCYVYAMECFAWKRSRRWWHRVIFLGAGSLFFISIFNGLSIPVRSVVLAGAIGLIVLSRVIAVAEDKKMQLSEQKAPA